MTKAVDMIGERVGILTVLKRDYSHPSRRAHWLCKCDCGNVRSMSRDALKKPAQSCGCLRDKDAAKRVAKNHTHKETETRLYKTWQRMKHRCSNKNHKFYEYYGGSGIKVCDEWLHDFVPFRNWAYANGYKEGLTIERLDVNKDYKPSNCKWIPLKEQANNRRSTVWVEYNGKRQNLKQWSEELGIKYGTLQQRHWRYGDVPPRLFRPVGE